MKTDVACLLKNEQGRIAALAASLLIEVTGSSLARSAINVLSINPMSHLMYVKGFRHRLYQRMAHFRQFLIRHLSSSP